MRIAIWQYWLEKETDRFFEFSENTALILLSTLFFISLRTFLDLLTHLSIVFYYDPEAMFR